MAVAPGEVERVAADVADLERMDVGGHASGIEERSSGHLLDAAGAAAGETEESGRILRDVVIVPHDAEAGCVRRGLDGAGNRARIHVGAQRRSRPARPG